MTLLTPVTQADRELLKSVRFDAEGFMLNPYAWTPALAGAIAEREGIVLTPRHWVVIHFVRHEFKLRGESPSLWRITQLTNVTTQEIYQLFPNGPANLVAKIAGLDKPNGYV